MLFLPGPRSPFRPSVSGDMRANSGSPTMGSVSIMAAIIALSILPPSLAQISEFTYSGSSSSLITSPTTSVSGDDILLNSTSDTDAVAFFGSTLQIYDSRTSGLLSFTTQFSFSSNSSGGTLAFAVINNASASTTLSTARSSGLTVEFGTACSGASPPDFNGSSPFYDGWYGRGSHRYGFYGYGPGGPGAFGTVEYVNGTAYAPQFPSWTFNDSKWTEQNSTAKLEEDNCTLPNPNSYPYYLFEVIVQYNATAGVLLVGSPTCNIGPRVYNFSAAAVAGNFTGEPYVGFVASAGGIYNVSQWNFTTNGTNAFTSLQMIVEGGSGTGTDNGGSGGGGNGGRGGGGNGGGLSKGAKIGIGVGVAALAAILVGVCCVCCCAMRRRNINSAANSTGAGMVMKGIPAGTTTTGKAMVFGLPKTTTTTVFGVAVDRERDTTPLTLTRNPSSSSTTTTTTDHHNSSWLPPVVPR